MVYGDHGKKIMHPFTFLNKVALFPFGEFYSKLVHFRLMARTSAVICVAYTYFAYKQGKFKFDENVLCMCVQ